MSEIRTRKLLWVALGALGTAAISALNTMVTVPPETVFENTRKWFGVIPPIRIRWDPDWGTLLLQIWAALSTIVAVFLFLVLRDILRMIAAVLVWFSSLADRAKRQAVVKE